MENVECFFTFKDNTVLVISSNKGIYNNVSNDMQFTESVKMDYLDNILFSDRAILKAIETKKPLYISEGSSAAKALSIMSEKKITSLLVSSDKDYKKNKTFFRPTGILHVHSLLKYGIK